MLERVSPSAECAAHVFLKRFEAPIQSRRILGPAFWRHNGDRLSIPTWWPLYLESVREKTETDTNTSKRIANGKGTSRICHQSTNPLRSLNRSFTQSSRAKAESVAEEEEVEILSYEQEDKKSKRIRSARSVQQKPFLSPEERSDPRKAWTQFIRQGQRKEHASTLLHILAGSKDQVNHDRAQTAFALIPISQRTLDDYRAVVTISLESKRYPFAIDAIGEVVSKGKGYDIYFHFLAHCIQNTLWNAAGDLWQTVGDPRPNTRRVSHTNARRSPNFAGDFTYCFDAIDNFDSKVIRLAERLQSSDPILAPRKKSLIELCKRLAYTLVESSKVISIIRWDELLSVFSIQSRLSFDSKLHFAALGTINRLTEKGTKSRLAWLIYSNYKSVCPSRAIPKWVFGALIGICSAGNERVPIFRTLLEDYRKIYGTPDNLTYSQVLRAFADQGAVVDVHTILDEFCKHGRPNADDLNPLIRVYAITGDATNAQAQFDKLTTQYHIEPIVKNWNTLLLAYARSNNPQQGFRVFRELRKSRVQPDEHSWSIIVNIAAKRGDVNLARDLMEQAAQNNISPPVQMIGALVDSYLFNGNTAEAERMVINATKASTTESPIRLWNSLFCHYAFRVNSAAILHTQQTMKQYNVKPDGMTYAALMTALVVQRRTREAAQILRTLHFSQSLNATEFHYSILIHGFTQEKRLDMARLVYQEMTERFSRITPSAALAMLNISATQDEVNARFPESSSKIASKPDFRPSLDLLFDTLSEIDPSDIASNAPNPGFGRKSAHNNMELVFYTNLIKHLQRHGGHEIASQVIELFMKSSTSSPQAMTKVTPSWQASLETLSVQLKTSADGADLGIVNNIWNQILAITLQHCIPFSEGAQDLKFQSELTNDDVEAHFTSMIPRGALKKEPDIVLPAYKYILSRPISTYILALDKRSLHDQILATVEQLRGNGFELSSKNWNTLIQTLCRSKDLEHQRLAFKYFDTYMLANTPSWKVIKRSKWVLPSEESDLSRPGSQYDSRKSYDMLAKTNPGLIAPTYFTMVHLTRIALKHSQSMTRSGQIIKRQLIDDFPRTFQLLRSIPYSHDRVQGVLLRNQKAIGDLRRKHRQHRKAEDPSKWVRTPPGLLQMFERTPKLRDDIRGLLTGRSGSSRSVLVSSYAGTGNVNAKSSDNEQRLGILQRVSAEALDINPRRSADGLLRKENAMSATNEAEDVQHLVRSEQQSQFWTQNQALRRLRRDLAKFSKRASHVVGAQTATSRRRSFNVSQILARKIPTPIRTKKARRSFWQNKALRMERKVNKLQTNETDAKEKLGQEHLLQEEG